MNKELLAQYNIPFVNAEGELDFPIQAFNGITYIWPKPINTKVGLFDIPDNMKENYKTNYGLVLSVGKGILDKRTGEFIKPDFQVGDLVIYDKNVPWRAELDAPDGKSYVVEVMNILDIYGLYKGKKQ